MNDKIGNKKTFEDAVAALRSHQPEDSVTQAAGERVFAMLEGSAASPAMTSIRGCEDMQSLMPAYRSQKLAPGRQLIVQDHLRECASCRHMFQQGTELDTGTWKKDPAVFTPSVWSVQRFAVAAMVLIVLGVSTYLLNDRYFAPLPGNRATVQAATGPLYLVSANGEQMLGPGRELKEGDVVRTPAGSRAVVRLFDGSVIEMNERAEFSVAARRNATTINLNRGNIIVQAAKQHGNLFVVAPDCKVSVTGTVFAVNSGMKGSRVSVVEGEVHVEHEGDEDVLHSGDQVVTSANMGEVPVSEEIEWSQNREQHLALLAEFSKLQNKLEKLPTPGLRFDSAVLPITPDGTVLYASIPNYGEALNEANRLFQDQLRDSPVLRDWWAKNNMQKEQPRFEEIISRIHTLSKYVGEEVVFLVKPIQGGKRMGAMVAAKITRQGLKDFLQAELDRSTISAEDKAKIRILSPEDLAGAATTTDNVLVVVSQDLVVISNDASTVLSLLAAKQAGQSTFAGSSFGQAISASYQEGAGLLFAADLQSVLLHQGQQEDPRHAATLAQSGFGDIRHLVVKRREVNGLTDNRALLSFTQQRRGIASWLAAPAPLGAIEFVSADATVVAAAVVKNPVLMVDDLFGMMRANGESPEANQAEFRSKMNFDLRDDLAASLGGDFALALDGPVLPLPSWKLVIEVNDQHRLQSTLQLMVNEINRQAALKGQSGIALSTEESDGRMYYSAKSQDARNPFVAHYTFFNGYMIVAPSRGLLVQAMQIRESGNSITRSAKFTSKLPKDQHTNVSALIYQDLGRIVGPLAENMNPQEQKSLQTIAANTQASLICAYGDQDRIEVATNSRFFGFDVNNLALSQLLAKTQGTLAK
ncbi:MAG TPA: FecR domain-containing protein [Terriglobales bacterium]|nr:FecR domain-containing protein [Terriglobales bacterium]